MGRGGVDLSLELDSFYRKKNLLNPLRKEV